MMKLSYNGRLWLMTLAPALAYAAAGRLLRALGLSGWLIPVLLFPAALLWTVARGGRRFGGLKRAGWKWWTPVVWLAAGFCLGGAARWTARLLRLEDAVRAAEPSFGMIVTVCLAGPICEELIYRGLVLDGALAFLKPGRAVAVSAAVFACSHGSPGRMLLALPAGMLFGFAALRSKTLLAAALAHIAANAIQLPDDCAAAWILGFSVVFLVVYAAWKRKHPFEKADEQNQ